MKKPDGTIRAAMAGDELTVHIHGVIGWDVVASEMATILDQAVADKAGRVVFEIYSPGGSVWDGNFLCSRIRELPMPTEARVYIAASMATLLAVSCSKVTIAQNGRWLVHNPWTSLTGDAAELEKRAKELRDTEGEAAAIYAAKTGQTTEEMLALMGEERWLTAAETMELGFADEITARYDQAAFADVRASCLAWDGLGQAAAAALEPDPAPAAQEEPADVPAHVDVTEGTGSTPEPDQQQAAVDQQDDASLRDRLAVAEAALATATLRADAAEARVGELTTQVQNQTAQITKQLADITACNAEIARREGVILDHQRRLRAFGAGLVGTDEDLDREDSSGATYWQKVAEFRAAGMTPEEAHLKATKDYPQLHAAMIRDSNRNRKGR